MAGDIDVNNHNHSRGEVRESEAAVIVAKNGGEQCCGSDVVGPTEVLTPKSNGNKDEVDGSYVFVASHDEGDDLVESDLNNGNNKTVEEFQVQEKNNGSCETEASGSLADEFNSPPPRIANAGLVQGGEEIHESDVVVKNSDELGFAEGVGKNEESEIGVESANDNNNNNNDVVNDGTNQNPDVVLKNSDELGLAEDVVKDEESELGVETDDNNNSNVLNNDTDQEVKKAGESLDQTPLEGSRDDPEQEDPSTVPSSHESELKLDTVIEETSIFNNIGDGWSDVHQNYDEALQSLDVHGIQNGSSEKVESVSSSGEIGDGLTDVHGNDDFSPSFEEDFHEHEAEQNAEIRQQSSLTALYSEKLLSFSKVEGSPEHNLEAASSSEADKTLETEVSNDLLFEQSGDSSSSGFADESLLETAVVTEEIDPPTALDNDKLLSFSTTEGSKGDDGESLEEHCLETPLSSGVDKSTETEVANCPLLEQKGEALPDGLAQESPSETAVVTEQNGSSKNGKSLNSFSICSDVALERGQSLSSLPFKGIENMDDFCHVETKKCLNMNDPESNCAANGVISNPESCSASNGGEEKISADVIDVESTISDTSLECCANQHMSNTNIELEPEVDDGIAANNKACGIAANGDLNYLKTSSQEAECIKGKHVDTMSKSSQENLGGQNVKIGENPKDEASTSLLGNTSAGQNVGVEVVKRPLYLIKIPRFDDGNLREDIKHTELQVVGRTKSRDAINIEVQKQRAIVKEYEYKAEASLKIEKDVRELIKSKRKDIESLQLEINKVKNAQSVKDIQAEIHSMEHMIGHETLPLKEEKQLIREMNRLKQLRQQLSSNMGKQDEFQQALDQKDQNEQQLKALKKKIDSLRECLTKAEEVTKTDKKAQTFEIKKLNELISQFRDANDNRQQAYACLQSLKKQLHERNKYFWRYKHLKAAQQLSEDKKELQRQCNEQVETIMKLWNRNDDFRKEYMRCNTRSTLRRLRTLDGRSLGPDEEPPDIPDIVIESKIRSTKDNLVSLTEIQEQEKEKGLPARAEKLDDKATAKVVEGKNQTAKIKQPAKLAASSLGSKAVTILGEDERKEEARKKEEEEEEEEEHPRRSKEEEELARRAEESRKEEEQAKLKQQRKLEEKAKAKEAMERKKRIAEKAQARAAVRAQKEAEEKEKEREKRARKKERKKATNGVETKNEDEGECAPTPSSEIPSNGAQPDSEKHATTMERPHKTQQFSKQGRTRSLAVPPPLRNRGKRRMQPWMWVTLVVAIVFALFLCWPSCLQWFGF